MGNKLRLTKTNFSFWSSVYFHEITEAVRCSIRPSCLIAFPFIPVPLKADVMSYGFFLQVSMFQYSSVEGHCSWWIWFRSYQDIQCYNGQDGRGGGSTCSMD